MARLLQVFGFLSVLFRGATLTFQSLAIGGIVFLISYVLANSMILRQSANMSLREVAGANFVLAGGIGIVSAFTVIALTAAKRTTGYAEDRKSTRLNSSHG